MDLATAGTGAAEVFALLGWQSLAPEGAGASHHTSIDAIRAFDPDVLIFQNAGMRQIVADSPEWRALRAVQLHRAYIAPDVPFGWLDEPPSINRLLGLAVLNARGGVAVALAATFNAIVYGRTPTAQQLSVLRESLLPLAQ